MCQPKAFFFALFLFPEVGQNLPTCPNSNQPTKQAAFRARWVQIIGVFSAKKGKERFLPPPPNSTQSKPNLKAFCFVFEVKIPWHFSLFDNMLLTEVKNMEICWFGTQGLQACVYHQFCGCTCTSLLLHFLYQVIIKRRKKETKMWGNSY